MRIVLKERETVAVVEDENPHLSERNEMETVESSSNCTAAGRKRNGTAGRRDKTSSSEEAGMMVVSEQMPLKQDVGQVQSVVEQIAIEAEPGDSN